LRIFCPHLRDDFNVGDLMAFYGCKYLLQKAFGNVEFLQFDTGRCSLEYETYIPEYNWGNDIDVILLTGSQWIGVGNSIKSDMVEQAIARWPDAKRIALGIGSFFSQEQMKNKSYKDVIHTDGQRVERGVEAEFLRDFDLIIVRDILAKDALLQNNIDSILYYDTSIFSWFKLQQYNTKKSFNNILVFCDPLVNDVSDHLQDSIWQQYINYQLEWADRFNAEIIVVTSGDKATLEKRQIKCRFATDLEWLASVLGQAKRVLSGYVHPAILAKIMGCRKVRCLPVDSQFLTCMNIGIGIEDIAGLFMPTLYDSMLFSLRDLIKGTYTSSIISQLRRVKK